MSMDDTTKEIAYCAIHPGIGIARVGNSQETDGYYIGPEVTNPPDCRQSDLEKDVPGHYQPGQMKDASGALKRQAARFRIYAYDKDGNAIREITADDPKTKISWTVEIANKKASWYEFVEALDLPGGPNADRRNANIPKSERHKLEICPKPQTVSGKNATSAPFDDGEFMGQTVYLGELRTDEKGRLLFLGGYGNSHSAYPDNPPASFGNNNGWCDDTSDGVVAAEITIDNKTFAADPAWVVTAPPNYGTTLIGVKTMLDVMTDVFINPTKRSLWWPFPKTVSFTEHILPIFKQFSDAQWVNYGFSVQFGHNGPFDFTKKAFLKKLSQKIPCVPKHKHQKDIYQEFRRQVYDQFRLPTQTEPKFQPDPNSPTVQLWPWMYGDTVQLGGAPQDANQYLCLTDTQLMLLEKWVEGDFDNDLTFPTHHHGAHIDITELYPKKPLEDYPIKDQPLELDRAAMHFCLGGAFHPGCEMTWPMRHATMYRAPFRIRPRTDDNPEPDYGHHLSHKEVMDDNGPLYFNAPGDITRWMAVPWQTDTSSCRSGYIPEYDPFLPTFWPARVPNHVLAKKDYDIVMNADAERKDRLAAFNRRSVWLRGLPGEYLSQIREMVTEFGKLGVVEKKAGPEDPEFPDVIYVESEVGYEEPESHLNNLLCEYIPSLNEERYWRERQERLGGG